MSNLYGSQHLTASAGKDSVGAARARTSLLHVVLDVDQTYLAPEA